MMSEEQKRMMPLTFDEWARWGLVIDTHPQKPEGWPKWEDLELAPPKDWRPYCWDVGCPKHSELAICLLCSYLSEEKKVK